MITAFSHWPGLSHNARRWLSPGLNWNTIAFSLAVLLSVPVCTAAQAASTGGSSATSGGHPLSGATVLIIRHAEKPMIGSGLSPEGQARAEAYVKYFQKLRQGAERLTPDYIVAADDSEHSQRSRLTVEPLAKSLGLKPDLRFQAKRPQELVESIRSSQHGKVILVCWHHREIPELLARLGADPEALLPEGEWPAQQFGWMLRLSFDESGRLIPNRTKRIKEHLMPDD
jgi:hypothetical protein